MEILKQLIVLQEKFFEFDSFEKRHDKYVQYDNLKEEIKNLIFIQKKVFSIHNELLHINFSDEVFKKRIGCYFNKDVKRNLPLTVPQTNSFRTLFQTLYDTPGCFAKVVYDYIKDKSADVVDEITFSTIPGLFGSLNDMSSIKSFTAFVSEVIKIDKNDLDLSSKFARPLFIIPSFLKFLTNVINSCNKKIEEVNNIGSARTLTSDFYSCFEETSELCPFFIRDLLELVPDEKKGEFLHSSFLSEMCRHPINFNIVKNTNITDDAAELLSKNFHEISNKLADLIMSVEKPHLTPHDARIDIKEDIVALTRNDIKYLREIVDLASKKNYFHIDSASFNTISCDSFRSIGEDEYAVFFPQFRDTSLTDEEPKEGPEGEKSFEAFIVNVLITNEQIPEGIPITESTTISQLLRMLFDRTYKLQRITLEVQITTLIEKYEDKSLSETVTLLEAYYKTKKKLIKRYLKGMSLFAYISNETNNEKARLEKYLKKKADVLIFRIVENWAGSINLFRIVDDKKAEYCLDSVKFFVEFTSLFAICNKYCEDYHIKTKDIELILFDVIMSRITLQDFITHNTEYAEEDSKINGVVRVDKFKEGLFGTGKNEIAKNKKKWGIFVTNKKLLEQPRKAMELIQMCSTPLQKFNQFIKTIKKLEYVCTCEINECGEDEKLPIRLLLVSLAKKFTTLSSTCHYLNHFMRSTGPEDANIKLEQLNDICNSQLMAHMQTMLEFLSKSNVK